MKVSPSTWNLGWQELILKFLHTTVDRGDKMALQLTLSAVDSGLSQCGSHFTVRLRRPLSHCCIIHASKIWVLGLLFFMLCIREERGESLSWYWLCWPMTLQVIGASGFYTP